MINEKAIRTGFVINLRDKFSGGHLDTWGKVADNAEFGGSPERLFVWTNPSADRDNGSGNWKIISADGKPSDTPLYYGDRIHLLNLHPDAGYLDVCSRTHDFTPFKNLPDAYGVFTHGNASRDQGSGTWIIESANGMPAGAEILEGHEIALRNAYPGIGYLYTFGDAGLNPAFSTYNDVLAFVLAGLDPKEGGNSSHPWLISCSMTQANFGLDDQMKAQLIPLTDKSSVYQYTIRIGGNAIHGDQDIPMHFDTGSWDVCIPERFVNEECTAVNDGINYNPWGLDAVKMTGDFLVKSTDGQTSYELKDFVFFKILDNDTNRNGDSKVGYLEGIIGGFPSKSPDKNLPSITYALAANYAAEHPEQFGFGIISRPSRNEDGSVKGITEGWATFESYLAVGAGQDILQHVTWRSDIPLWHEHLEFCPEAVPGFSAEISIPGTDHKITSIGYIATIDTGAPDFTARLGSDNAHLNQRFTMHFTKEGAPSWWSQGYDKYAWYLKNANVRIKFEDDNGIERFYTFDAGEHYNSPATFVVSDWDSPVPWVISLPLTPENRANLGNTIYYYANIMYYDFGNKRVGFCFI